MELSSEALSVTEVGSVLGRKQLFDLMLDRVDEVHREAGLKEPQAFARWFAQMYFLSPQALYVSDGSGDGKVDAFFKTDDGTTVTHHVLNSKFTQEYDRAAPVAFYDEITRYWQAFDNKTGRTQYLKTVRQELRPQFQSLFRHYDNGTAKLAFVTDHRRNPKQNAAVSGLPVDIFHLEDLLQLMVDHIEHAMPRTPTLTLHGISSLLAPDKQDAAVPTSIVFARLLDFVEYMRKDPFDLVFARNVRLSLGETPVNKEIRETYEKRPREFVYSNNGITMLCERHHHDPGSHEVRIENPRVVNGSQTLHSIRDASHHSPNARVMVRIIQIAPPAPDDIEKGAEDRREIIRQISTRTNQQNRIKKWNLVSQDGFHNDLAWHFRRNGLFYERREKEWSHRRTELKSVGVSKGPRLPRLMQLIASYHWDKHRKGLGPANAKQHVASLFELGPYEELTRTPTELAFQIYLLGERVDAALRSVARTKKWAESLKGHADLALFAIVVRTLDDADAQWRKDKLTTAFTDWERDWTGLTLGCLDLIRTSFDKQAARYWKQNHKALTTNNFFKSQAYVGPLLETHIPRKVVAEAAALIA